MPVSHCKKWKREVSQLPIVSVLFNVLFSHVGDVAHVSQESGPTGPKQVQTVLILGLTSISYGAGFKEKIQRP